MTQADLDELCGKTEVTHEMLMKLVNDEWYFEQMFNAQENHRKKTADEIIHQPKSTQGAR